jgi:hypothetical protein
MGDDCHDIINSYASASLQYLLSQVPIVESDDHKQHGARGEADSPHDRDSSDLDDVK